jgi:hypothetical protein
MWLRKEWVCFQLLFFALCAMVPLTSSAQQNRESMDGIYSPASKPIDQHARLIISHVLTPDEGLAVLGAALESRPHPDLESDCSHLVHAIYERAGFPYSYANSSALYAGSAEFRRVARPQPGDLVVWPGHVGIAVNPAQRSFFSALRSGLGVNSYDSAYWRERGRPRFFRYIRDVPTTIQVAPSSQEATLKTTTSSESDARMAQNPGFTQSEQPETQTDPAKPTIQLVLVDHSLRPNPKEVTDALEQTLSEAGEVLRGEDVVNPPRPLIVFDRLFVERVHLQDDRGWVEIRLSGAFKLPRGKTNLPKHAERQRWLLVRRDYDTWELTLPPEAIYVPNNIAVRKLAHQLATLTDETAGQTSTLEQKVELSRLLRILLEEQPGRGM